MWRYRPGRSQSAIHDNLRERPRPVKSAGPPYRLVLGYWTDLLQTDPEALQTRIDRLVATICTPVLAIFGDQIASSERLRLTRTLGAEVEEWIGSGHFVHLIDPDRFVSRLLAFAARCEATAPSAPTPV